MILAAHSVWLHGYSWKCVCCSAGMKWGFNWSLIDGSNAGDGSCPCLVGRGRCAFGCLSRKLKVKGHKKVDSFQLSREGCPNPIPPSNADEVGWLHTEKMLQRVPWANVFVSGPESSLWNRHKVYCYAKSKSPWVLVRCLKFNALPEYTPSATRPALRWSVLPWSAERNRCSCAIWWAFSSSLRTLHRLWNTWKGF